MSQVVFLLAWFSVLRPSLSHSWISCTDCLDSACTTCRGYARNWFTQPSIPFSQDQGWDRRPGKSVAAGGLFCDDSKQVAHANVQDGYTDTYPMASYTAGQTVTMQWPAKNHATVGFQRNTQLFIGKGPGLGDDFSHITSLDAYVSEYPGLEQTYSNCVPNQAGVDGAPCSGDFTLPSDLAEGFYSFIWWWEFNEGEYYSTCFDAWVSSSGGGGAPAPGAPSGNDSDECLAANLPADVCPKEEEAAADGIVLSLPPSKLNGAAGSSYTATVKYDFSKKIFIVPEVWGPDGSNGFIGGGLDAAMAFGPGKGTASLTVTLDKDAVGEGQLNLWTVAEEHFSTDVADEPWANELGRIPWSVKFGDANVACTSIPVACKGGEGGGGGGGQVTGILVAVLVAVLLMVSAFFGVRWSSKNCTGTVPKMAMKATTKTSNHQWKDGNGIDSSYL
ncbi:hypothetical protein TrST_g9653 [Triparma strigata]|nr:hypothetical protein TrST_g9653 [Triparma strigata]